MPRGRGEAVRARGHAARRASAAARRAVVKTSRVFRTVLFMKRRMIALSVALMAMVAGKARNATAAPPPEPDASPERGDVTKLGMFAGLGYLASAGGGAGGSA